MCKNKMCPVLNSGRPLHRALVYRSCSNSDTWDTCQAVWAVAPLHLRHRSSASPCPLASAWACAILSVAHMNSGSRSPVLALRNIRILHLHTGHVSSCVARGPVRASAAFAVAHGPHLGPRPCPLASAGWCGIFSVAHLNSRSRSPVLVQWNIWLPPPTASTFIIFNAFNPPIHIAVPVRASMFHTAPFYVHGGG